MAAPLRASGPVGQSCTNEIGLGNGQFDLVLAAALLRHLLADHEWGRVRFPLRTLLRRQFDPTY